MAQCSLQKAGNTIFLLNWQLKLLMTSSWPREALLHSTPKSSPHTDHLKRGKIVKKLITKEQIHEGFVISKQQACVIGAQGL